MKRKRLLSVTILGAVALAILWQRGTLLSQPAASTAVDVDPSVRTVRVRFGVHDKMPAKWDGSAEVIRGSIVRIRNWHPRPGDRVDNQGWSLATRKGPIFAHRAWDEELNCASRRRRS